MDTTNNLSYEELAQRVQELEALAAEAKRTELAFQDSLATERALMASPVDSILLLDAQGVVLDVNLKCAQAFGREVSELKGRCIYDFLPSSLAEQRRAYVEEVIRLREPARFEDERAGRSFDHSLHPIVDARGQVRKIVIVARDITERVRAEKELLFFNEIVDNMAEGVVLVAPNETIVYANPTFERMFGYEPGEMVGMSVVRINADTGMGVEAVNNWIRTALASKGCLQGEIQNIRKDGSLFWSSFTIKGL